jgi:catechol 2,3-dioxygenase
MTTHPTSLGHVHLKVREVDRAVAFYRDVLGLAVRERSGRYAFLTYGDVHHDLALQAVPADADEGPGPGVGLYHAAFEAPDAAALAATHERLREREVAVSPVDHGISKALYFDDPDGNGLEVYLDTRDDPDEEWGGTNEPFDPRDLEGEG